MRHTMKHGAVAALVLTLAAGLALPVEAGKRSRSNSSVNRSNVNRKANRNTNVNRNANVNRNTNVNRNRNVNIDRDIDIDIDVDRRGGYHGGCCYHPVATAAAVTATAMVTAAVVGSMVNTLPPSCSTVIVNGFAYQQCGNTWYQPQLSGSSTTYVVINAPR